MPIKKDPKVAAKKESASENDLKSEKSAEKPVEESKSKSILDDLDLSFDEPEESISASIDDQESGRGNDLAVELVGSADVAEDKSTDNSKKSDESPAKNFVSTTIEESESRNRVVINGLRNNNRNRPARMRSGQRNSTQGRVSNGYQQNNNYQSGSYQNNNAVDDNSPSEVISGVLDLARDGHGVLRVDFANPDLDAYISTSQIKRFKLRPGDMVTGPARKPKENERYWGLLKVDKVNDLPIEESMKANRANFQRLTPVYPNEHIKLEIGPEPLSLRIIDMIAPIGKGQRSLIVSPPKAGKTTLLKDIATGVAQNNPEVHIIAVLVGERPEEVTDIRRHIDRITKGKGEVSASNFDESAQDQVRAAEIALERAKRMVEMGQDVMILLDSITRLARAYNLAMPTSGRTLSGGFDPAALFPPKKFFGAARNFEIPGSLTIVGTALVDTGSRMDDLIYEEFKGTGNQEVHLDRRLAERRVHPSIEVQRSGTRRDDLLIDPMTYQAIATLHRMLDTLDREERTITLLDQLKRSKSNKEFLAGLKEG